MAASERARAYVAHRVPGRTRVRVPEARGDAAYFERAERVLANLTEVDRVHTDHRTGSVLVCHRGDFREIEAGAERAGLFVLIASSQPGRSLNLRLKEAALRLDRGLRDESDGILDLGSLATVAMAGAAALQVVRGAALPAAGSLLWQAASLVRSAAAEDTAPSSDD